MALQTSPNILKHSERRRQKKIVLSYLKLKVLKINIRYKTTKEMCKTMKAFPYHMYVTYLYYFIRVFSFSFFLALLFYFLETCSYHCSCRYFIIKSVIRIPLYFLAKIPFFSHFYYSAKFYRIRTKKICQIILREFYY